MHENSILNSKKWFESIHHNNFEVIIVIYTNKVTRIIQKTFKIVILNLKFTDGNARDDLCNIRNVTDIFARLFGFIKWVDNVNWPP